MRGRMKNVFLLFLFVSLCSLEHPVRVVSESWIGAGFFAEFRKVLYQLVYDSNEETYHILKVDWTQPFFPYKDDPACNGWDLYFEPIRSEAVFENRTKWRPPEPKHDHPHCIQRWHRYAEYRPYRQFMHDRLSEYIVCKREVRDVVDAFYEEHLKGHFCIGVHVRYAAAHSCENPYQRMLKLQDYIDEAKKQLDRHCDRHPKLFIATDSHYVIEMFQKHFPTSEIVFTDAFRSLRDEDPHLIFEHQKYYVEHPEEFHKSKPGYRGGLMTLADCLLLSKCDVMVHSLSNVSDVAAWFNPDIESIFLPKGLPAKPCQCENLYSAKLLPTFFR
jgi:Nodulation protein Z (NodZ)